MIKNQRLCTALVALLASSSSAWGMEYYSSWGESEDSIKAKVVSGLALQILPPLQNGETIKTRGRGPDWEKSSIHQNTSLDDRFIQEMKSLQKMFSEETNLIKGEQADNWPYSAHGMVHATFQKGNEHYEYLGPGILIAPNLVLTAANNLYHLNIHEDKPIGRAKEVKFYPLLNNQCISLGEQKVRNFYFPEEYTHGKGENYGLLVLENPIGETTGYLGVNVRSSGEIFQLENEKKEDHEFNIQEELLNQENFKTKNNSIVLYSYNNNNQTNKHFTKNGSGNLYKDRENNYYVIGVNVPEDTIRGNHSVTYLTKLRYEKIRTWIKYAFEKFPIDSLSNGIFSSVESVDLTGKYIRNFGEKILCDYAKNLHTINLSHNSIGDGGCYYFIDLPVLTALNLSSNKIGNLGFSLLMQQRSLKALDISHNYITLNNVSGDLFENSSLLSLDLSWNLIDHEGAMIPAQHPYLTKLNLSNNKINDAGKVLLALAKNTHLKTLIFSNPYEVSTSRKTMAKMGKAAGMMGRTGAVVSVVALTGATIGLGVTGTAYVLADKIGVALVTNIANQATLWSWLSGATFSAINGVQATCGTIVEVGAIIGTVGGIGAGTVTGVDVNAKFNKMESVESKLMRLGGKFAIGREEAQALSENTSLTELDLSDTQVTTDIIEILAKSPSITSLNLSWNELDDDNGKSISNILENNKTLTHVNLQGNNIKDQEVEKTINALLSQNIVLKEKPTPQLLEVTYFNK